MKYKMVVSDYDGTLATDDKRILPSTIEAIRLFEARGGKFVICTGRMTPSIMLKIDGYGLSDDIITYQGGTVINLQSKKVLYHAAFSSEKAGEIIKKLEEYPYQIMIFMGDYFYSNSRAPQIETYAEAVGVEPKFLKVERLSDYVIENNLELDKIMLNSPKECALSIIEELKRKFDKTIEINTSASMRIEVIDIRASKGVGISKLADYYGIKKQEIIAIGDSMNDVTMFSAAGLGVAMQNGMDVCKAAATIVTSKTNEEDGVGEIIRKYCLSDT